MIHFVGFVEDFLFEQRVNDNRCGAGIFESSNLADCVG
jgi:hypothetical protein